MNENIQGPAWDNSTEYSSLDSAEIKIDFAKIEEIIQKMEQKSKFLSMYIQSMTSTSLTKEQNNECVLACQNMRADFEQASILLSNIGTFANCVASVDGKNAIAKQVIAKSQEIWSKLEQVEKPLSLFLSLSNEEFITQYLNSTETKPESYNVLHLRKMKPYLLSLEQENLISTLSVDGFTAWGNLYDNISSHIECEVNLNGNKQKIGVAKANAMLQNDDQKTRMSAYEAIQQGWCGQQETCASILNSISGWRHSILKQRSKNESMGFLTKPLHDNHIKNETLEALFVAINEAKDIGQKALRLKSRAFGKKQLHPSDLFAPPPKKGNNETKFLFSEAISIITDAFAQINPQMGEFVQMMHKNKWIEGTVENSKRPGAYCTSFAKSRTPRVYMTYMGGMGDVSTLAHELGHAFHSWVMRDLPYCQLNYPMNLAETASIFAETVVANFLADKAKNDTDLFPIAWDNAESAAAFLLNIPSRFMFEKEFYEKRREGILTSDNFKQIMQNAWKFYYGDTLSEMNDLFWASKLHFYITEISFYNFPYSFGYLFSLGVYAQRNNLKENFYSSYISLLRDTGRMSAEDLIQAHLGEDISKPEFWRKSIAIVNENVSRFEKIISTQFV